MTQKMILKHWKVNQCVAACIITLGGFAFGCGLSWTATAIPNLEKTGQIGNLTPTQKSLIASLFALGALLACPIIGLYVNLVGRKIWLLYLTGIGLAGWILLGSATDPVAVYFGRLLTGVSTGGYTIVVPMYVSEVASKSNRGILGSIFVVMLTLGKLFSNLLGITFSSSTASYICAIHPILYASLLLLIPESPKYLLKCRKLTEAEKSFQWLETSGFNMFFALKQKRPQVTNDTLPTTLQTDCIIRPNFRIHWTFQQANAACETGDISHVSVLDFLKSRELRTPTAIVFLQMFFAQFCGINVSTFFTVEIFSYSENVLLCPEYSTVILAIIQTFGCLPCSLFVDKYGRKVLMTTSFFAMFLSMLGMAAFFFLKTTNSSLASLQLFGLLPILCLVIYNLAYSWGIGTIVWIIMSELLPPEIAGPASAVSNIIYWGGAFCITNAFQMFNSCVPLYTWFAGFSLVCILGFSFNIYFLPETKGLSSHEIQQMFHHKDQQKPGKSSKDLGLP